MTGLPAGRLGQGVTKGYFAQQPNRRGRQLGRVLATRYDEIVVDRLYDGKRQLDKSLQPLLLAAEDVLDLSENRRKNTSLKRFVLISHLLELRDRCARHLTYI